MCWHMLGRLHGGKTQWVHWLQSWGGISSCHHLHSWKLQSGEAVWSKSVKTYQSEIKSNFKGIGWSSMSTNGFNSRQWPPKWETRRFGTESMGVSHISFFSILKVWSAVKIFYSKCWNYSNFRVMSFGGECIYREYRDMVHGWMVRGDVRKEEINNCTKAAFNSMLGFLNTYLKWGIEVACGLMSLNVLMFFLIWEAVIECNSSN